MVPPGAIYRLGRKPDPWAAPDWIWADIDGTFGNRYDDPLSTYRVLYASSQRLGCFLETLARFRPDPKLASELAEIEGGDDFQPLGVVPLEWFEPRAMGSAMARGNYADICSSEWISALRSKLARHRKEFGFDDLDASVLQRTTPRRFTQLVSRAVCEAGADGIYYRSKYGHDIENWALFEPFKIEPARTQSLELNDPDLARALQLHSLTMGMPTQRRSICT